MVADGGIADPARLNGARVLVVEDEYYIADDLRRVLDRAGATVVGPISNLSSALAAVDEGAFDCAVIDLNLQGQSALPLANRLIERGKPFAIATGYGSSTVPEGLRTVPRLEKPFGGAAVIEVVQQLGSATTS